MNLDDDTSLVLEEDQQSTQIEEQKGLDETDEFIAGEDQDDSEIAEAVDPDISEEEDSTEVDSDDSLDIPLNSGTLVKADMVSVHETYSEYYTTTKTTLPFMTKFEKAKIIGVRAQMLSGGAEPMVLPPYSSNCYDIALRELSQKKIPLIVRRYLPNNKFEDWRVEDLIVKT